MPDSLEQARSHVRERANALPEAVWDCERCGADDSMAIRRSSLNEQFRADDILLKCMDCWYAASHGVPFTDPAQFEHELDELREGQRVLDFAWDGDEPTPEENLAALGYIAGSEVEAASQEG